MYQIVYILNNRMDIVKCHDKPELFIILQALKEEDAKIINVKTIFGDILK